MHNPFSDHHAGLALCAGFTLVSALSGGWLTLSGRPLGTLVFAVHKLSAVAAAVLLFTPAWQALKTTPVSPLLPFAATALLVAAITGALLSLNIGPRLSLLAIHGTAALLLGTCLAAFLLKRI